MNRYIFSLLAICLLPAIGLSQEDLPDEQVDVMKRFEATLLDTKKQSMQGMLPKEDESAKDIDYVLSTKDIEIAHPEPKIRPLGMKRDKLPKVYKSYLKGGYGIPSSPYFEAGYHHSEDPMRFNIHAKHHGANFKNLEHQKFGKTFAEIDGKFSTENNIGIGGAVRYDRHLVHFYGYDHEDTTFAEDVVKQIYSQVGVSAMIANEERISADMDYKVGGDVYFLSDNFASKERGYKLLISGTKWFAEKHPLSLNVITDFTNFEDTLTQNLNNIYFQPSFTYHANAFSIKAGGNIVSHKDEFTLLPDIELSLNLVGSSLAVFAGWTGDMQKNTLQSLSEYNPFINSRFELRNTTYQQYYGGIRGNLRGIEYSAQLGLKNADDLAMFLPDSLDSKTFSTIYDTASIFFIKASAKLTLLEGLDIAGTISQSVFDPKNEEKAWHLPALETNINASYKIPGQNLKLKAELYAANGVPYLTNDRETDNLNALLDLSAGAEYFINDNIGIFFDVNNLLNNKRERWQNYPVYGLNVLGGIFAKF